MKRMVQFGAKGLALALGGVLLSALTYAGPAGKYREEIRNPFPRSDYTIIRTLNLNKDGKADLYTEYKGEKPDVNAIVRAAYGGLLTEVRDHRKVRHSGTWRTEGRQLVVELDRLDTGDEDRRVSSDFEFTVTRDGLAATKQDSGDYGAQKLRLEQLEDWGSGDGGDDLDTGRYKGAYGWGTEVKAENGRSYYMRRLKLNGDGSAELISEYSGKRPRVDKKATEEFGVLFAQVAANRKITHKGKWRDDKRGIRVDLDRVGGGDFAERISSSFVFDPRSDELVPTDSDTTDYGNLAVRLRKNWSPNFEDSPDEGRPPKPTPYPGGGGDYTELDRTGQGAGILSHEGSKAREFDRARLILKKDGRFEIRLAGGSSEVFEGRYDLDRNNTAILDVREAFGGSADGSGRAELGGKGGVAKITLRGEARGRRFTLNFSGR